MGEGWIRVEAEALHGDAALAQWLECATPDTFRTANRASNPLNRQVSDFISAVGAGYRIGAAQRSPLQQVKDLGDRGDRAGLGTVGAFPTTVRTPKGGELEATSCIGVAIKRSRRPCSY